MRVLANYLLAISLFVAVLLGGCAQPDLKNRHNYLDKQKFEYRVGAVRWGETKDHRFFRDVRADFCAQQRYYCDRFGQRDSLVYSLRNFGYGTTLHAGWYFDDCEGIWPCYLQSVSFDVSIHGCVARYDCSYTFHKRNDFVERPRVINYAVDLSEAGEHASIAKAHDIVNKLCSMLSDPEYCVLESHEKYLRFRVTRFKCCHPNQIGYDPLYGLADGDSSGGVDDNKAKSDGAEFKIYINWYRLGGSIYRSTALQERYKDKYFSGHAIYSVKEDVCRSEDNCSYRMQRHNFIEE